LNKGADRTISHSLLDFTQYKLNIIKEPNVLSDLAIIDFAKSDVRNCFDEF